jgi:hypothetical protein
VADRATSNRAADDEFFELATRHLAGELDAEGVSKLFETLAANERCRQTFVELSWQARLMSASLVPALQSPETAEVDERVGANEAMISATYSPVLGFLGGVVRSVTRSPLVSTLIVAAVIYGVFGFLAWDLRPNKLSSVAVVRDSTDLQWSKNASSKSAESSILPGEPLKIESGTVELELNAGTRLVVEGPAEWSVDGRNNVSIRTGRLIAHVPEKAIGFTLETPTATIVDLGTEFGVDVDATGRTDVQVITGKVAVDYETSAKPDGSHQTVRMTAGAARRFSSRAGGGVTVTPISPWVDQMAIGKNLSGAHRELPAEAKYAAAVLADRPIGYWRFSDQGAPKAVDASGHGNHGKYVGFVSTNNPGVCPNTSDQSIRFLGKAYAGYVQISEFELPASFTVELWARSASPEWNTDGWLLASREQPRMLFHPDKGSRNWRFLLMDADGTTYRTIYQHLPARIDDRLHHYVGAYDCVTDRGWMYFDGALVAERVDVLGNDRRTAPLQTTIDVGRDIVGSIDRYGEGWIDEVAFYDRVLTADSVLKHYRTAMNLSKAVKEESDSRK